MEDSKVGSQDENSDVRSQGLMEIPETSEAFLSTNGAVFPFTSVNSMRDFINFTSGAKKSHSSALVVEFAPDVGEQGGVGVHAGYEIVRILKAERDRRDIKIETGIVEFWKIEDFSKISTFISRMVYPKALICEGGSYSAYDPASFTHNCSWEQCCQFMMTKICVARETQQSQIDICLSHQMMAVALTRLVRIACSKLMIMKIKAARMKDLAKVLSEIGDFLRSFTIIRGDTKIAEGFSDLKFAVSNMDEHEVRVTGLHEYVPSESYGKFTDIINAHRETEDSAENLFMKCLKKNTKVPMFHGDEVNEGAILALNYAFKKIHAEVSKVKESLKFSDAKFLLDYPCGVLICGSTEKTKVACVQVIYETGLDRSYYRCTYTMQFHPELTANDITSKDSSQSDPDYLSISSRDSSMTSSTPMEDMMWEMVHTPFVRKKTKKSVWKKSKNGCFPCTFN